MALRFEYVTVSSEKDDELSICKWLKSISVSHQQIALLNYYMEMPIVSKAQCVPSDEASFVVSPSSENQIKIMSQVQKTIIQRPSELFILANCQAISLHNNEAVLTGFRYIAMRADQREACRVRLLKTINVSLITEVGKITGLLKDISLSGCRVSTFVRTLQPGARITLALKMFDATTNSVLEMSIDAVLMRVANEKMPIACGLRFENSSETEEKLIRFINQRQMELIKSLKDS